MRKHSAWRQAPVTHVLAPTLSESGACLPQADLRGRKFVRPVRSLYTWRHINAEICVFTEKENGLYVIGGGYSL